MLTLMPQRGKERRMEWNNLDREENKDGGNGRDLVYLALTLS